MMDGQVDPVSPRQLECIKDIHTSGQYLLSLISEILDITKMETGKIEFPLDWFSLGQMLDPIRMQMIPFTQKKDLEIFYEIENSETLLYSCMLKLQQVLFNLLENAVKFTPTGGKPVTLSIRQIESSRVKFTVKDHGIGIRSKDKPLIFQKFTHLDKSAERNRRRSCAFEADRREIRGGFEIQECIWQGVNIFLHPANRNKPSELNFHHLRISGK